MVLRLPQKINMSWTASFIPFFSRTMGQRSKIMRILAADSKRSFWALADQGVASFGSFGVNILLGRAFQQLGQVGQFGNYWTLMELMIFLNGLQGALIIYPMTVRSANLDSKALGKLTSFSLMLTLLLWPILAAAILVTAFVSRIPLEVGLWAAVALIFWQIQETTRRSLMAHLRFRDALIGDVVSFAGQVGLVAVLFAGAKLSLATTFQAMAITSALGALIQAIQIKPGKMNDRTLPEFGSECWNLGRWMLAGNLTNFIIGPLFAWNLRFWLGDAMMGVNYALSNLVRIANPLAFAIASMIVPSAARAAESDGIQRSKNVVLRLGSLGALMLVPYLGFLFIFPRHALALVYGWDSTEYLAWAGVLRLSAIATLFSYAGIVTGSYLNGINRSKLALRGQLIYAVGAVVIAMPFVALFGVYGAAMGWIVAAGALAVSNIYYIVRAADPEPQANDGGGMPSQSMVLPLKPEKSVVAPAA